MDAFYALIDELMRLPPLEREAAERRIRDAYEVERAVLALDMSGFSLSVRRSGIIAHLAKIRRVRQLSLPIVAANGGEVVKCEADNILAVFPDATQAVKAAVSINREIAASRAEPSGDQPPTVGIGIDFGKLLLIAGKDAFGDPVNIAHKLGEDVARASEILVTEEAMRLAGSAKFRAEPMELSISGLELSAWRIVHDGE